MRILLANSTCKVGGVSTFMLALRRALVAAGHSCELFFFQHGPMEAHLPQGWPIHFGTLADCLRLVHTGQFDVVHANNVDWPTGISAVRHLGARLVLTAHKVREPAWTYGWRRANCDALITVSNWIREALQPHTDVPIETVHNGIDTGRFAPDSPPSSGAVASAQPIVAWVGRSTAPRKRLELFAAAAPGLRARGFKVWVIDQQGPERFGELQPDAARQLTMAAERWTGVGYDEMPQVYREIAASGGAVVSTATMEGLPLTLLEAQACGALVVGATAAGVDECVSPDHGGTLFAAGHDDLGAVVAATLGDPGAVRRRQQQAVAYVANQFSLERMTRRYLAVYETARRHVSLVGRGLPCGANRASWATYRDQRLGVGYRQYDAATQLTAAGEPLIAIAAARAALATAPTMFARPSRLWQLATLTIRAFWCSRRTSPFRWLRAIVPHAKAPARARSES